VDSHKEDINHNNLYNKITPWSRVLLGKLTGTQQVKKSVFYGKWRFITTFTKACHWK